MQTTRKTTDHEPPTPPPIAPPHYHRIINEIMSGKRLSFVIASSAIGRWGKIVVVEIVVVVSRTHIKCPRENDRVAPDVNCAYPSGCRVQAGRTVPTTQGGQLCGGWLRWLEGGNEPY